MRHNRPVNLTQEAYLWFKPECASAGRATSVKHANGK